MTRKYSLYQVDSFTKEKFIGNPAGVITNADGLNETEMQKIARELNNSETAFIFSPDNDDHDVHVRFFTPQKEVPICSHATIAAHYVRALEMGLGTTKVLQKTGAGILPVDIVCEKEDYKIIMTQGRIEFGAQIDGKNRDILFSALKITEEDLISNCPLQIVSTGHSKVMIGIKNNMLLHHIHPDCNALSRLSEDIGCNGYYVFTLNSEDEDILVNGRMFAPAIGINEDPVTGNANGPLGAYLVHYKLVKPDGNIYSFKAAQGEAMGRAGTIEVEVQIRNEEPVKVRVAGKAVIAFKAELVI